MEFDLDLLIRQFHSDAEDNLNALEQSILSLENDAENDELVHVMFRHAHTLRGNASIVGFDTIEKLSRKLEDVLQAMRQRSLLPCAEVIEALLQAIDVTRSAVVAAVSGSATPDSVDEVIDGLDGLSGLHTENQNGSESTERTATTVADGESSVLKVDVEKLDRLLDLVGEQAIARSRLRERLERAGIRDERITDAFRELDRLSMDIQESAMEVRMVPIGPVFKRSLRVVRDLAHSLDKKVRVEIEGADVQLDTTIITELRDPLMHMIRNSVDHGIETESVRIAAGKAPYGTVSLSARHESGAVVIELKDDGRGIDADAVLERARAARLLGPDDTPSRESIMQLIFQPGLTTSTTVTDVSGRGVGMDVVKKQVEALRGSVSIASTKGVGTRFEIRLPLTLAIVDGFQVEVGNNTFVIPLHLITECLDLGRENAAHGHAKGVIDVRGKATPFVRLRSLFGIDDAKRDREFVVIVETGYTTVGIGVDRLCGETQTVIKPLADLFRHIKTLAGSAVLGDGRVALVLDLPAILELATSSTGSACEAA